MDVFRSHDKLQEVADSSYPDQVSGRTVAWNRVDSGLAYSQWIAD